MSRESEQEPVTITDKRRIDPATGEPRPSTGFSGGGSRAAGVPQAPDAEDVSRAAGAGGMSQAAGAGGATPGREPEPHDAEPTLAEEALIAEGEVVDVAVEGEDDAADPVARELLERTADLQRLSAEYANYRRRVERDRQAVIDAAKAAVAGELLGVLDDLERARSHGDLDGPLKSVADKLSTALTNQGLTSFGAVGEPFDPAVHEAVSHDGTGGEPVVGIVMRQGYRFGERVLRPAMVGVTDAPHAGGGPVDDTIPGPGTVADQ